MRDTLKIPTLMMMQAHKFPILAKRPLTALLVMFCSTLPASSQVEIGDELVFKDSKKSISKSVYRNMTKVQLAAEQYASHHSGKYPVSIDDKFKSFFPFGSHDDATFLTVSCIPNPVTKKKEWATLGKLTSEKAARAAINDKVPPGVVEYSPIGNGQGFIIRGGNEHGKPVTNQKNQVLLLISNDVVLAKCNMLAVQWAVESYAEQNDGKFPKVVDDEFKCYLPGGDPKTKKQGRKLYNPFTKQLEWPLQGKVVNTKLARAEAPRSILPGTVEYSAIAGGLDYAIRGGDKNGKVYAGPGGALKSIVLCKDGEMVDQSRESIHFPL